MAYLIVHDLRNYCEGYSLTYSFIRTICSTSALLRAFALYNIGGIAKTLITVGFVLICFNTPGVIWCYIIIKT